MRAVLSGPVHVKDLRSGGDGTAQIAVIVGVGTGDRGRVMDAREHRVLLRLRAEACARATMGAACHRLSWQCASVRGAATGLIHVIGVPNLARARAPA